MSEKIPLNIRRLSDTPDQYAESFAEYSSFLIKKLREFQYEEDIRKDFFCNIMSLLFSEFLLELLEIVEEEKREYLLKSYLECIEKNIQENLRK